MIYCDLNGRLGNQLFQYSFCRSIQELTHEEIILSEKKLKKQKFKNSLKDFNIKGVIFSDKNKIGFKKKTIMFLFKFKRKLLFTFKYKTLMERNEFLIKESKKMKKYNIFIIGEGYVDFGKISNDSYIDGCFESRKYFDNISSLIKDEISPKFDKIDKNKKLYEYIENNNSICVSIRAGDFLTNKYKKDFYVCDQEYFQKAIEIMKKKVDNPRFIIFSDDINFVKERFEFPENTIYEEGNDPIWEKLRLMYQCKHFIISNSTFSWWAQFLSRNKEKIVVCPKKWKNTDDHSDLIEDGWIKI